MYCVPETNNNKKNTPEKYASLKPFLEILSSEWNLIQMWSCEEIYGGGIVDPQAR